MHQHLNTPITPQQSVKYIQSSEAYELLIPSNVQRKIDILCSKISNREWSGTLFYEAEGSFLSKDLKIKILDLYLQDIGNTGSTTFEQSPELVTYMIDNDLLMANRGLIHSHHSMPAFFSATDHNTMQSEALDNIHFLSLIVNNFRVYKAAISVVETQKNTITIKSKRSYITFNEVNVDYSSDDAEVKEVEEKVIIAHPCNITIEDYADSNSELHARIKELLDIEKANAVKSTNFHKTNSYVGHSYRHPAIIPQNSQENTNKQTELFDNKVTEIISGIAIVDKDVIVYKTKQLLTLNLAFPKQNYQSIVMLVNSMKGIVDNTFVKYEQFEHYLSDFIEYIVPDVELQQKFHKTHKMSGDEVNELVARSIKELLITSMGAKYVNNKYFNTLLEELDLYIFDSTDDSLLIDSHNHN